MAFEGADANSDDPVCENKHRIPHVSSLEKILCAIDSLLILFNETQSDPHPTQSLEALKVIGKLPTEERTGNKGTM